MIKINKFLICSERNYNEYLARKILKNISSQKDISLIKSSYLNKLNLIDFPIILSCFHTFINKSHQEDLVKLILLSRSSQEIDLACSNAATILAKSDFIFKDIDFSRIRIPKADLSQRLFVDVNFEGSYLKEVCFIQSQFQNVNFKNCDLSCANFGYFKNINLTKGKGLSFSFDDKYFWYKNDDSIIEVDLISQRLKNEYSLIDFITTNISGIYSLRFKPSSTTIHGQYINLWDNYDKSLIYQINICRVVISPNLKYIAAINANSTILSWDLEKKMQFLGTSNANTYRYGLLLFSPSNRCLAIIRAKYISLIETETWTLLRKIWGNFVVKNIFALSYCSKKIAFNYDNSVYLLDTITSEKTKIHSTISDELRCLSFSPCGKFLAYGQEEDNEYSGLIIDIKSHQIFQIFAGFESNPESVIFSASGKYISWNDFKGNIRIYEFSSKFCQNDKNRHLKINYAKISPKYTYLITSSSKNHILWNLNNFNPKQIKQFTGNFSDGGFVFSPHETYLIKKQGRKPEIYDIKHDYFIKVMTNQNHVWYHYSFSHCENYLICLNKVTYEYFRIPEFIITRKISINPLNLSHIKFSDCGNYDFWYDNYHNIYVWDLVKGDCMKKIDFGESIYVFAATSFLSKISFLITIEKQKYIAVIDIETGEIINIPIEKETYCSWGFADSNGTELVGGFSEGIFKVWDLKTKSVKQKVRSLFSRFIDWVEIIGNHIIIKERNNVEIFNLLS